MSLGDRLVIGQQLAPHVDRGDEILVIVLDALVLSPVERGGDDAIGFLRQIRWRAGAGTRGTNFLILAVTASSVRTQTARPGSAGAQDQPLNRAKSDSHKTYYGILYGADEDEKIDPRN